MLLARYLILAEVFRIWEKQNKAHSVELDNWILFRNLESGFSSCSLIANDKKRPFLVFYEKYRMSSFTTCLIRNSDTRMFLVRLTCRDRCISSSGSHQQIREFFPYQNDQSEAYELQLDSFNSFLILCYVNKLIPKHRNHRIRTSILNAKLCSMLFSYFWRSEFSHGATFLTVSNSNLLHSRQNLKQTKHMREITHYPVHIMVILFSYQMLITWITVSSLSSHKLHLLFSSVS